MDIASKDLVGALASEHDLALARCSLAQLKGRNDDGIADRQVHCSDRIIQPAKAAARGDDTMLRAISLR
jgi:hypothetical protein